jgi:hypothetical protein
LVYFHGFSLAELIWNSDSILCLANAAAIRGNFDFLQAAARSVEEHAACLLRGGLRIDAKHW